VGKKRYEVSTLGVDEALQGLSSDPFAPQGFTSYAGLRVPLVLPGVIQTAMPRYRFLLATRKFNTRTKIVGLRQGITIGCNANIDAPPERPIECNVVTPGFRFDDGNVSWHLVKEEQVDRAFIRPTTDTQSWAFMQSESPAMLYQTFTNSNVNPQTGAPIYYNLGLTAYSPPKTGDNWRHIAALGNFHDLRFPWNSANGWDELDIQVDGSGRISLYATVLQTNPATRNQGSVVVTNLSSTACPEEAFIQDMTAQGARVVYWRIFGAIVFEDDVANAFDVKQRDA
jgi:hypothetical protein